ncbi:MAG: hypothetical protein ACJAVF_002907, partial [Paraglaciecola sp.]
VAPPAKNITFNPNLKINDGVMVAFLQKKHAISVEEAQAAITQYVDGINATLAKKEIVEIPRVGRLYLDYENKMKFLPEGTNFSPESFGLPTVKFYPVLRKKTEIATEKVATGTVAASAVAAKAASTAPPYKTLPKKTSKLPENWWLWLILLIAIPFLMYSFYSLWTDDNQPEPVEHLDNNRVNTSPSDGEDGLDDEEDIADFEMDEEDGINYQEDLENATISDEEPAEELEEDIDENIDTEIPVIPPSAKKAFVVVHSFGSKRNAERFSKKLIDSGYNSGSEKDDGLYRVGVNFVYETKSELNDLVSELGRKFKSNPKVWDGGVGKKN